MTISVPPLGAVWLRPAEPLAQKQIEDVLDEAAPSAAPASAPAVEPVTTAPTGAEKA